MVPLLSLILLLQGAATPRPASPPLGAPDELAASQAPAAPDVEARGASGLDVSEYDPAGFDQELGGSVLGGSVLDGSGLDGSGLDEEPFSFLHAHRLEIGEDGVPLITVGIDRGKDEFALTPRGAGTLLLPGGERLPLEGGTWRFTVREGRPATLRHLVKVEEVPLRDREALAATERRWIRRGFLVERRTLGAAFALGGHLIDTRRRAVVLTGARTEEEAEELTARARSLGASPTRMEEAADRQGGTIEVRNPAGRVVRRVRDAVYLEAEDGIVVHRVEHDMGYAAHGREDRAYRGGLFVTVDAEGKGAVVNLLPLEDHIRGIVPSEIFASAPMEALKAQAVAARGEVLAKIGARHLADPFLVCAEQHCQVYKGIGGEHPRTDQAVRASWGEVLLGRDGTLVDTVYSSTCGGHTEDNEAVWGTPPDPHLRGRPDRIGDGEVDMCQAASFSRPDKYRWVRSFPQAELDRLVRGLGVGSVREVEVLGRGVSGRVTGVRFVGTEGEAAVHGELRIRRLLANLNSSRFEVERDGGIWRFTGAGWGHGVGMCQMGAIGRAEAGESHHRILGHYYGGAETVRLYAPREDGRVGSRPYGPDEEGRVGARHHGPEEGRTVASPPDGAVPERGADGGSPSLSISR